MHHDEAAITHKALNHTDIERVMIEARRLRAQAVRDASVRFFRGVRDILSANARLPGVWPRPA
ncbi:RSP_7527 family protein [Arhodomonas sp. AD133]|uniref:RSP_7527 family protein n=1 Tax=Arhodomonas sp. AD133 TaxID=3415009 RepID=UPI003EB85F62